MLEFAELGQVELELAPKNHRKLATYVLEVDLLVLLDVSGDVVDLVGDILRSRSTVGSVELDTKVVVRSTWVVRRGKEDTTIGLVRSNQGGDGRGGEDRVLTDDDVLDTVTGSETENDLGSFWRLLLAQHPR